MKFGLVFALSMTLGYCTHANAESLDLVESVERVSAYFENIHDPGLSDWDRAQMADWVSESVVKLETFDYNILVFDLGNHFAHFYEDRANTERLLHAIALRIEPELVQDKERQGLVQGISDLWWTSFALQVGMHGRGSWVTRAQSFSSMTARTQFVLKNFSKAKTLILGLGLGAAVGAVHWKFSVKEDHHDPELVLETAQRRVILEHRNQLANVRQNLSDAKSLGLNSEKIKELQLVLDRSKQELVTLADAAPQDLPGLNVNPSPQSPFRALIGPLLQQIAEMEWELTEIQALPTTSSTTSS